MIPLVGDYPWERLTKPRRDAKDLRQGDVDLPLPPQETKWVCACYSDGNGSDHAGMLWNDLKDCATARNCWD